MVGDFQFFKEKTVLPLEMQRVVQIYICASEYLTEKTSSDMLAVIWTMPLATIDATVLISGLSLLILVAGPVLLVLGADEESSAASVMPSLAADPGSRGETRGGGGGGRGGGGWGGGGGGDDQGRRRRRRRRRRGPGEDRPCSLRHRQLSSS